MSIITCYIRLVSSVIDMKEHIGYPARLRELDIAVLWLRTHHQCWHGGKPQERVMNEKQKRPSTVGDNGDSENPSGVKSMKRTFLILAALAAAFLFGGLVYAVLVAAHVSEPAATTVYGPTSRRLWATTVAALALGGVLIGGLALARPASRFGTASGRLGAIVALMAGLIATVNGGLVLAIASGGPGSGNGVVGGAGALVLGLIALALGGLGVARSRRLRLTG